MRTSSMQAPAGLAHAGLIVERLNCGCRELARRLLAAHRPTTVLVAFMTVGSLFSVPLLLAISLVPLTFAVALYCFMRAMAEIAHSRASHGDARKDTERAVTLLSARE